MAINYGRKKNTDTKFGGTDGIIVPSGETGDRVGTDTGKLRYNTTLGLPEFYTSAGWSPVAAPPTITTITGTINVDTDSTITVNGTNFVSGAVIVIEGAAVSGITRTLTTTFVNSGQLTANTAAATLSYVGAASYDVRIINPSGLSAVSESAGVVDRDPVFTTPSGTIATVFDGYGDFNPIAGVVASDPDATGDQHFGAVCLLIQPTAASTTVTDISNSSLTITNNNVTLSNAINDPFGGNNKVMSFNGSNAYLAINSVSTNLWQSNSFTIEWWAYTTATKTDALFAFNTSVGNNTYFVRSNQVVYGGSSDNFSQPTLNAWHHYAFTLNNNTYKLYIDGTLILSTARTFALGNYINSDDTFSIGQEFDGGSATDFFQGYMYGFRITKGLVRYPTTYTNPSTLFSTSAATGGITFAVASGSLPAGTSLNSTTGVISGDPNDVANDTTSTFSISATSNGFSASRSFSIIVSPFLDGSSSAKAAPSAASIKTLTGTNTDGVYWIKPAGAASAQQVYCVMDSTVDGGGWMAIANNGAQSVMYTSGHIPRMTGFASYVGTNGANSYTPTTNFSINLNGWTYQKVLWQVRPTAGSFALTDANTTGFMYFVHSSVVTMPTTSLWYFESGFSVNNSSSPSGLNNNDRLTYSNSGPMVGYGTINERTQLGAPATLGTSVGSHNPITAAWYQGSAAAANAGAVFSFTDYDSIGSSSGRAQVVGFSDWQNGAGMGDTWGTVAISATAPGPGADQANTIWIK
jgi:hypothetical protein